MAEVNDNIFLEDDPSLPIFEVLGNIVNKKNINDDYQKLFTLREKLKNNNLEHLFDKVLVTLKEVCENQSKENIDAFEASLIEFSNNKLLPRDIASQVFDIITLIVTSITAILMVALICAVSLPLFMFTFNLELPRELTVPWLMKAVDSLKGLREFVLSIKENGLENTLATNSKKITNNDVDTMVTSATNIHGLFNDKASNTEQPSTKPTIEKK